ncbi:MAG TPA: hypothetical protein DCS91_14405 [Microcoleaceae bacterium UBA11344]|nr:hypothetical protein [Microcoleaceae cyanobacterium UBA11344]
MTVVTNYPLPITHYPLPITHYQLPISVNNQAKTHEEYRFYSSPDPPKSPLRRGTLKRLLSPPS